jgi:hypothetical protein
VENVSRSQFKLFSWQAVSSMTSGGNEQVFIILMELSEVLRSQKSFLVASKVLVEFWRRLLSCFLAFLLSSLFADAFASPWKFAYFRLVQPVLHPPAAMTWFKYYHCMTSICSCFKLRSFCVSMYCNLWNIRKVTSHYFSDCFFDQRIFRKGKWLLGSKCPSSNRH